ncbi:hypothetical protein [Deinococcus misasensis]|uniref:hypothetical protein n=1 Tax=Deinococcus misasensis TaxID=392413 RepID=UPI000552F541|nr:hypothetical protein [Deinococcus misasensis]
MNAPFSLPPLQRQMVAERIPARPNVLAMVSLSPISYQKVVVDERGAFGIEWRGHDGTEAEMDAFVETLKGYGYGVVVTCRIWGFSIRIEGGA